MSIRSIRVSHIVLSTEELANTLLEHLRDDEYKDNKDMLYKICLLYTSPSPRDS